MTIRLSKRDLESIQKRALAEGIPCEALVWSVLRKYAQGRLREISDIHASTSRRSVQEMGSAMPARRRAAIDSPEADDSIRPRLLNMRQSATYLGCSFWTIRDYVLQGLIPAEHLPPLRARKGDQQRETLRRVVIDRADLDIFIESRTRRAAGGAGDD